MFLGSSVTIEVFCFKIAVKARTPGDGADHNKSRKALSTTNCEESEVQLILVSVCVCQLVNEDIHPSLKTILCHLST